MSADSAGPTPLAELVPGVTEPKTLSVERFPIRTRGASVTQSGWRLAVACGEGPGAIVRVEDASGESFFRGEGVFLGWSTERLEAAFGALLPGAGEPDFEIHQLG